MNTQELYYPIAVLIEELRNEDVQLRLNSIRQLKTIAIALGPEKTCNQLIPFLSETLCDEDEVLYALAEQLGSLGPYVGSPDGVCCLLSPLESLSTVEDVVVRDKAIESLRHVITLLPPSQTELCGLRLVNRLSGVTWYTARIVASALISVLYPRIRDVKRKELHGIMKKLSGDEAPAVRRALAGRLGELAVIMNTDHSTQTKSDNQPQTDSQDGSGSGDSSFAVQAKESSPSSSDAAAVGCGGSAASNPKIPSDANPPLTNFGGELTEGHPLPSDERENNPTDHDPEQDLQVVWDVSVERSNLQRIVLPIYSRLLNDEHESVRLMALESITDMVRSLDLSNAEFIITQVIKPILNDQAWRVRCVLAQKFVDLFSLMKPKVAREYLMPIFLALIDDVEAEVRAVVAGKIKPLVRCLIGLPAVDPSTPSTPVPSSMPEDTAADETTADTRGAMSSNKIRPDSDVNTDETAVLAAADKTIVYSLLPALDVMANDNNSHVRCALATAIVSLSQLFGKSMTVERLLPLLLLCLEDDSPEVRVNLICNLEQMNSVIGVEQVTSCLLPLIMELAEDPAWRVRLVLIDYMPVLAQQLGMELFDTHLATFCLTWLADEVYAIREAAVDNMIRLSVIFGQDWTKKTFMHKVLELATDKNYLRRMICLEGIIRLSEQLDPAICLQHFIPVVLSMQTDHVPNIRFKVAQALGKLGERMDQSMLDERILPCLLQLSKDLDQDVKYFAEEALEALHLTPKAWPRITSFQLVPSSPPLTALAAVSIDPPAAATPMDTEPSPAVVTPVTAN